MFAITLVTDLKGLRLARYAIASLILSQDSDFRIHLHTDGFDLAEDDPIRWLASSRDRVLEGHRLSSHEFADMRTAAHISPAQFLKFAAIRPLIGQYDRVLYIDTDLLFFRSVPFETFAMGGHPVAAVHDVAEISGITSDTFQKRSAANGLSQDYFNSGLMLFRSDALDLAKLRSDYARLVAEHQESCPYKENCRTNDQCVWNLLFQANWQPAPLAWNMQASMRFTKPWADADVRHYTGPSKALPVKSWRSDMRETRLVRRIAHLLGDKKPFSFNPGDIFYRANGLRWRRSRIKMEAAYGAAEARQPQQVPA